MGQKRLKVWDLLAELIGNTNVYFNPPPATHIKYPSVVATPERVSKRFANNILYFFKERYTATLMSKTIDIDDIVLRFKTNEFTEFVRYYEVNGIHHWTFYINI